jgi:hypothetical protein
VRCRLSGTDLLEIDHCHALKWMVSIGQIKQKPLMIPTKREIARGLGFITAPFIFSSWVLPSWLPL